MLQFFSFYLACYLINYLCIYVYMYINSSMWFYSPANSGLKSDLRGTINGCNWAKYVIAHIKNIIAILRITVLLQTL